MAATGNEIVKLSQLKWFKENVVAGMVSQTIAEEASEREKQDGLLEDQIVTKIGTSNIKAGTGISVSQSGNDVTVTSTVRDTNTTYTLSKDGSTIKLTGSDGSSTTVTDADTKYTLPTASGTTLGGVKVGSNITNSSGTINLTKANVTAALGYTPPTQDTNTWIALKGATSSEAGTAGYAPAPSAGASNRYLRSDGTWAVPPDTNTTYSNATSSTAGLMSSADKAKLDGIAPSANNYSLPDATTSVKGGVKVGSGISVSGGTISTSLSNLGVTATAAELNYMDGVTSNVQSQLNSKLSTSGNAASATKATQDSAGQQINTTYVKSVTASGRTVTVTKGDGKTSTFQTQDTTYGNMGGASTSAAGKAGLVPAPSQGNANRYLRSDGTWQVPPDTNTTYSDMKGATSSAAGTHGLVPAPATGANNRYLRSDGTWAVPPDTNTTYSAATTSTAGLMSASDKTKLDGIASGANKTTVDSALSSTSTNPVQNKVINSALSGKAASSHTHPASQVTGLTANRALVSDASGHPAVSAVTNTELGYLDGVTSSIQTQLNGKAASNHTHNYAGSSSAGGAANSAVKLQTARTINGTSFDGTVNITTSNWGTARTFTVGNSGKSVNGSGNVSWSLSEMGAVNKGGDTMNGTLTLAHGSYAGYANASGGTAGWEIVAELKVSSNYQNIPIEFGITRRNNIVTTRLYIQFASVNTKDPSLQSFRFEGGGSAGDFYMYKSSTSTWRLYVKKTEAYDNVGITHYTTNFNYMSGVKVTLMNTFSSSVPSGATAASPVPLVSSDPVYIVRTASDTTSISGKKVVKPCILVVVGTNPPQIIYDDGK